MRTIALPLLPHGEYANAMVELYSFSRRRWRHTFEESHFTVIRIERSGIFYTGFNVLPSLSLRARQQLAPVLGSACHLYVTRVRR